MKRKVSRRSFLGGIAAASASLAISVRRGAAADAPPPRETGLSSEGLLEGLPGFQPRTVAPPPHEELPASSRALSWPRTTRSTSKPSKR